MVSLLELKGEEIILEPCAGDGVFIDSIVTQFGQVDIEAFELNDQSFKSLSEKYAPLDNVSIKKTDTLTDIELEHLCSTGGKYDAIIGNPPYGAWRNTEERKKLKKKYDGLYAKESYALFLYRSVEALRDGGRLVFIIPDTYLNLHMHKGLRKYLLMKSKIREIALFPSSYFPGVNFGYANLSIIALEKCADQNACLDNTFSIIKGYQSVDELGLEHLSPATILSLNQRTILKNNNHAFLRNSNPRITACLKKAEITIGDICDCVTGFYSGNDKKFLKVLNKEIRNSKRYDLVNLNKVTFECSSNSLAGITTDKIYVPIVKGGNKPYVKPDHWFMEWSADRVSFFKADKKARYQNAPFYFRKGIGVPMVSSRSITGALIENRLFDQSIVGVFPKKEALLYFLLAFFNSPTCNQLIRTLNPSANNSSNYIKKIPLKIPGDKDLEVIIKNTKKIVEQVKTSSTFDLNLEVENHRLIHETYGF